MSTRFASPAPGRARFLAAGGAIALAVLLAACSASGSTPASSPALAPDGAGTNTALPSPLSSRTVASGVGVAPASAALATTGTVAAPGEPSAASGSGAAGASIAYPYIGSAGVAPDHTIVVSGTGTSNVAGDGSGRPAAERSALDAAVADARAQADAVAAAARVTIDGVLSVSASVSPYFVYPMGMAAPSTGGTSPGAMPPTVVNPPQGPTQLTASVTVAYTIH